MASKKKSKKVESESKKEFRKEIKHLEIILNRSLQSIDGKSEGLDSLFTNQANRIRSRIQKLKENQ